MIPDFKTYINESVWSDIHKRSNGSTVRKEDFVEDIEKCLNSKYRPTFASDKIEVRTDYVSVPIFLCYNTHSMLWIGYDHIEFSPINPNKYGKSQLKRQREVLNKFYETFIEQYPDTTLKEFDGSEHWYTFTINEVPTKEFCVELIDFILDNLEFGNGITPLIKRI